MQLLLPLILMSFGAEATLAAHAPGAEEVLHWTFGPAQDEDFDGWPDGWVRQRGIGFPHYVTIRIQNERSPDGDQCLRIDLSGGAAAVRSPAVTIEPEFSYVLEAYLKTEGLRHDEVYISLAFLGEDRRTLATVRSIKVRSAKDWEKIRVGPISPPAGTRSVVIGLHVDPTLRDDLQGKVCFAGLWLGRLPDLKLAATNDSHLLTDPNQVEVDCTISGLRQSDAELVLRLEDVEGRQLAQFRQAAKAGVKSWRPPVAGPGFYRIDARIEAAGTSLRQRQLGLAVVDGQHGPAGGPFGWSLPCARRPGAWSMVAQLAVQAGIHWVKCPLWREPSGHTKNLSQNRALSASASVPEMGSGIGSKTGQRADDPAGFLHVLNEQGLELVGVLANPPESLAARFDRSEPLSAATIFSADAKVWRPSLEPVMARFATAVRWWQLGDDQDRSFVGVADLPKQIAAVQAKIAELAPNANLGIAWDWTNELPQAPVRFLSLSSEPAFTPGELAHYLDGNRHPDLQRWVLLQPLRRDDYPLDVRSADLARRMVAAKVRGADAVFAAGLLDDEYGLVNEDGTPGELFLPWRTTALMLADAMPLGRIHLPGSTPCFVFARGAEALMVLWTHQAGEEVVHLGDRVRQTDLWGRSVTPTQRAGRSVIRVDRLPAFLTGVSSPLVRWWLECRPAKERIASVFGDPQPNALRMKNPLQTPASGVATLVAPPGWLIEPRQIDFNLAAGQQQQFPFTVTLPAQADSGPQTLRVDFAFQADRLYRFSTFHLIEAALDQASMDVETYLNRSGDLQVRQRLVNRTDRPLDFRCQLLAPGRRLMAIQVTVPGNRDDVRIYHLPEGSELVGKPLWLRAELVPGPGMLNHHFVAEP